MFKRIFDIVISILLLSLLLPLILFVSFKVYQKIGKPIFFIQSRPGQGSRPFNMIKFRTMLNITDDNGKLHNDQERLPTFGKQLRSTSLDELPELWNVLKGEMSIVGPRPLLLEYLPLYSVEQARRHELKPGITGWAQINGRNSIDWDEKFNLDLWYVNNHTMWLDVKIILITLKKVLMRHDISQEGEVTMTKFKGNNK
jgi:lipopolysaccharide/colanic/teichoic acid biosynthesis glycosyltransferase